MRPPGNLEEWPSAKADWAALVNEAFGSAQPPALADSDRETAAELRVADWPAVPLRARECLGRERADALAGAVDPTAGDIGRALLQEEYAEWRLVRDARGRVRFELTTELPDYWALFAANAPKAAAARIAELTGASVTATDLFGGPVPRTRDRRSAAFLAQMTCDRDGNPPRSPLNNGLWGLICLSGRDNALEPLARLVRAAAAAPHLVTDDADGRPRFPSGSQAIAARDLPAYDRRASDPLIVERLVRLAAEGRRIRCDDPLGIYVIDVQLAELIAPDGKPLPEEWCRLSRCGADLGDGLARFQRVELEVPAEAGFTLADVRSRRTGEQIAGGADIAELVQVAVYLRCGPGGAVSVDVPVLDPLGASGSVTACDDLHAAATKIEAAITAIETAVR